MTEEQRFKISKPAKDWLLSKLANLTSLAAKTGAHEIVIDEIDIIRVRLEGSEGYKVGKKALASTDEDKLPEINPDNFVFVSASYIGSLNPIPKDEERQCAWCEEIGEDPTISTGENVAWMKTVRIWPFEAQSRFPYCEPHALEIKRALKASVKYFVLRSDSVRD